MKNVAKWVSMPHAWNQVSNVTVIEGRAIISLHCAPLAFSHHIDIKWFQLLFLGHYFRKEVP